MSRLRELWREFWQRSAGCLRAYTLLVTAVVAVLGAALAVSRAKGVDIGFLTRDPLDVAGMNALCGCISNLTVLLWCSTAAVCLFAASTMADGADDELRRFLRWAGVVTFVLTFDDFFMLHERLLEGRVRYGELIVLALDLSIVLAWAARFRSILLRRMDAVLAVATISFGVSLGVDLLSGHVVWSSMLLLEDGAKLLGVASWMFFFVLTARAAVTQGRTRAPCRDLGPSLLGAHGTDRDDHGGPALRPVPPADQMPAVPPTSRS